MTPKPLLVNRANASYVVTDQDGRLLRLSLTSDDKYRLWTPLAAIPAHMTWATLNYEDRQFYRHPGVNPWSLLKAGWHSLIARDRWMGASTITMQLARQRWRLKTDTIGGKWRQLVYALWLEVHFSKAALLEAYLNLAPYGGNVEGVGAAAWVYFHKPAAQLNIDEARALALIPQNPAARAPWTSAGRQRLGAAWQAVYPQTDGFERLWFRKRGELPLKAPHFAERLHGLFPERAELRSTLDSTVQALSDDMIKAFVRHHGAQGIANAGAMVIHLPTMAVRGYVGSADYLDRTISGYVNGLRAPRSPGSTLKPFIYALALAQGLITPDTVVKDTPLRIGDYQPENFERNFYGPLSATDALIRSRNIPAISLLARLKQPNFEEFLTRAGIVLLKPAARYGLSLAIGGAEISMEDLLKLYGMLGNRGELRPLNWLAAEDQSPAQALLSAEAAFLVRDMLTHNPRPQRSFGGRIFGQPQSVAWKTGTSSGLKDAWAIGLMGDWLVGVWVGNFDGHPNRHLVGRDLAGPLLFDILDAIAIERPVADDDSPPPGVKRIELCAVSGLPINAWCPHRTTGWTIPGVSPIKACTLHRPVRIDPATGLRLCPEDPTAGEDRVVEFWASDELAAFRQAGVQRDTPPPYRQPCAEAEPATEGGLSIVSPQAGVIYPIRSDGQATIEFSAVASGGNRPLFWFVDDHFVGEGATLHWPARPGRFEVVLVDEYGHSASVTVTAQMAGG